jgi:hypothetical protein
MSSSVPSASPQLRPAVGSPVALGVCPGGRAVGLAIASREHLVRVYVLNLAKIPSDEGREQRFRTVLLRLLDAYGIARVAVVLRTARSDPRVHQELAVLRALAFEHDLPLGTTTGGEVRRAFGPTETGRHANRAVASALVTRYPALRRAIRSDREDLARSLTLGLRRTSFPSPFERYWSRMFLALGAAVLDLEGAIQDEVTSPAL